MPTPRQGKRLSAVQGCTRRVRPESCRRPRDAPSVGAVRRADFSVAGRPAHRWSRRRQVLPSGSRWPDPRQRSGSGDRNARAGFLLPEPCLRAARSSRLPVFRLILVDSDVAFIGKPIGVIGRRQGISPVLFLPRRQANGNTLCSTLVGMQRVTATCSVATGASARPRRCPCRTGQDALDTVPGNVANPEGMRDTTV